MTTARFPAAPGVRTLKTARSRAPLPPVRVRRDPPTLEEAVFAAQGLSDDLRGQVEIAAGLMGVPEEEVRPLVAAARTKHHVAEGRLHGAAGAPRVVVLKRRSAR
jgi:hypothetical protein